MVRRVVSAQVVSSTTVALICSSNTIDPCLILSVNTVKVGLSPDAYNVMPYSASSVSLSLYSEPLAKVAMAELRS